MVEITFPDKCTLRNFLIVCQLIVEKENHFAQAKMINLDLSRTTFIDPFGMITLLSLCRHFYNTYQAQSKIVLPEENAGSYMERAGFNTLHDHFIEVQRPKKNFMNLLKKNENMGVLRFFQAEADIKNINDEFENWMRENGYSEYERNSLTTFVSEMIQNVCQHSKTKQYGVVCIQAYISKRGDSFLSWAIGDSGIGIRQSLIQAKVQDIGTMSDERVIREVITKGISRHQEDKTRGNGLNRLYQGAQKRGASLYIQSNSGLFGMDFDETKQRKFEVRIPFAINGTNIGFFLHGKHLTSN